MESITEEVLLNFINSHHFEKNPTQLRLCIPIINRLYKKMKLGIEFPAIQIHDDLICDGHHRYLSAKLAKYAIEYRPGVTPSSIIKCKWEDVYFDTLDWDSGFKIDWLNQQDARYNDIELEILIKLLE